MSGMFDGASSFNQPIGKTKKVEFMPCLFNDAVQFDQDISEWDTSNACFKVRRLLIIFTLLIGTFVK